MIPVCKIQRFSTHDGPGVRTVVFVKGCALRCAWCHNPEMLRTENEILTAPQKCSGCGACVLVCPAGAHAASGAAHTYDRARCSGCGACAAACPSGALENTSTPMTVDEIFTEVLRDAAFYRKGGGLTLSGGEPLRQAECLHLLELAKKNGVSTAVETSGFFPAAHIPRLAACADHIFWDFKDSDDARHRRYTGASNQPTLGNLCALNKYNVSIVLRCILLKGLNMDEHHYAAIAALYQRLRHCRGAELLAYHPYGAGKREQLGLPGGANTNWIPEKDDLKQAAAFLAARGVPILNMPEGNMP